MSEEAQWEAATFEGNRIRQHEMFRRLTFREKVVAVEEMGKVVENLLGKRAALQRRTMEDHLSAGGRGDDCGREKK